MFYKSITAYKIEEDLKDIDEEAIVSVIKDNLVQECGAHEEEKSGFDYLLEETEDYYLKSSGAYIFKVTKLKKDVPASVLNETHKKEVLRINKERGEKMRAQEKKDLKDSIRRGMLSKAFVKSKGIEGYVDLKNNLIVVNTSSDSDADLFVQYIRLIFDITITPLEPSYEPKDKMTYWLENSSLPDNFTFGNECVMQDELGEGKISITGEDLTDQDIVKHIQTGKTVISTGLIWYDRISFNINNKFKINKIKFSDQVNEQISEELGESDDEYSKLVASYFCMIEDFNELLEDLINS